MLRFVGREAARRNYLALVLGNAGQTYTAQAGDEVVGQLVDWPVFSSCILQANIFF